jgi:hypothetical protein
MFIETITAPCEVWRQWTERLRLFSDPTAALFASVAWDNRDGTISAVNVWDNPSAVADFFLDRVESVIASEGKPDYKPVRRGAPVASYFREAAASGCCSTR